MKKKILSCLMTSLLLVGSVLGSTVPVQAETINGENVRTWINGIPYSDWSTIQKNSDDLTKTQYKQNNYIKHQITNYCTSDRSAECTDLYFTEVTDEYFILRDGNWTSKTNSAVQATNQTRYNYVKSTGQTEAITTVRNVYYWNKWGFNGSTGGNPSGGGAVYSSNTVSGLRTENKTADAFGNIIALHGTVITAVGSQADNGWGYRIRFGNTSSADYEVNEFNRYRSGSGVGIGDCGEVGASNLERQGMCYENRVGQKTGLASELSTTPITEIHGYNASGQLVTKAVSGFGFDSGSIAIVSRNNCQKDGYLGCWVWETHLSLLETTYNFSTSANGASDYVKTTYTPSYTGFSEWIDSANPPTSITAKDAFNKTYYVKQIETRTLYSHPLTYNVDYHTNSGVGSVIPSTLCIHGSACTTAKNTYTKTGYLNGGWALEPNAAGYVKDGATINSSDANIKNHLVDNRLKLYAKWIPITYEIRFNANGGVGAPSTVTKTYDTNLKLPDTIPTREGFEFMGWSLSPTAIAKSYDAGQTITSDLTTVDKDHKTFYAVWKSKAYVTLASQDVYIALGTDESEALYEALNAQSVADINYGISKDDIYIKRLVYENGTAVDMPTTVDTSKLQRIEATYAIIGADNVEKTSTSYIYIVKTATEVSEAEITDPVIFSRFVDCDMANFGIYYANSVYKNDTDYAIYLEEVCKPSNTDVEKSITVYKSRTEVLMGDVNGDGKIDSADREMLKGYLTGKNGLTVPEAADLNGDGVINSLDRTILANMVAGRI